MNAIEVHGLKKSYGDFTLGELDLTLPQGAVMGLVGENGAGKSTLIRLIMHSSAPDSGSVRVLGTDSASPEFLDIKQDIGVVLDEAYFPEVMGASMVAHVMRRTYKNWDDAKFSDYLRAFDLPEKKPFSDYSRGMRMKLAIAVALSHSPKLLILDEATSGLDPMARDGILDILGDFTRDETHSILLSSHIVSDLEKICDYIAFIHKGKLLLCGEKDALMEEYALVKLPTGETASLDPDAVIGLKRGEFCAEALLRRDAVPRGFTVERTTLEDIILFFAKGDTNK